MRGKQKWNLNRLKDDSKVNSGHLAHVRCGTTCSSDFNHRKERLFGRHSDWDYLSSAVTKELKRRSAPSAHAYFCTWLLMADKRNLRKMCKWENGNWQKNNGLKKNNWLKRQKKLVTSIWYLMLMSANPLKVYVSKITQWTVTSVLFFFLTYGIKGSKVLSLFYNRMSFDLLKLTSILLATHWLVTNSKVYWHEPAWIKKKRFQMHPDPIE